MTPSLLSRGSTPVRPRAVELRPEVAAFAYHDVADDPTASGFQRPGAAPYRYTTAAFTEHLDRIAAGPYRPERIGDIDLARPGRHLLLTFDDGGKSARAVSDELGRRGWRGHFFIVTSLIGGRTFLNAADIRYIRTCGHVIGSHSHTHPDIFRAQSPEQMLEEWRVSREVLSSILGEPCRVASVPGGDISHEVLESADAAGFEHLFTSEPWTSPRRVGACWVLGRYCPKVGMSPARVHDLANFRGWTHALLVRRLKVLARRSLPSIYELYVRRTTRART